MTTDAATSTSTTTAASARRAWWRPVARAVFRRVLGGAVVVAAVVTLTFALVHLAPGDPFGSSLENPEVTEAVREAWRRQWGLDRPLPEQYARYVTSLAHGDWGYSFSMHEPVRDALARALPNTLFLMGIAYTLSFAIGVAIGALQAARRGTLLDRAIGGVALFFYSVPDFWLALMVMLTLAYWVPLFPTAGMSDPVMSAYFTPAERVVDLLRHVTLPALTLTLINSGAAARYQRAALLDALKSDYVRTARAKGLPERRVLLGHALRNSLLPTITLMGLAFPALLAGAVFVEKVFAWPGMGWVAVNAVNTRDYPLVLASVVVGSALTVAGSALADASYAAADPRLRAR
ncbi:MAG TPA: ABC transporter permease [Gemmatimonadaceae bacterium]|nr:ABC transporter permease [Gemmatimonadaceae bacterium]